MTTYAGQNVGARKYDRVEKGAREGTIIAAVISAVITSLILIFWKISDGSFYGNKELVELSMHLMQILAVGYIAMGCNPVSVRRYERRGRHHDTHVDIPDNNSSDSCPSRIRDRLDDKNAGASQRKE